MLPVEETQTAQVPDGGCQPLMLLTLNATDAVEWDDLKAKVKYKDSPTAENIHPYLVQGKVLAAHLAKPLSRFREHLAATNRNLPSATPSPDRPTR